jgi:hypothetical protein
VSSLGLSRPRAGRAGGLAAAPLGAGVAWLAASIGVAVWELAGHVSHGWWLVSFLGLVGGVAQLLLGAGGRGPAGAGWPRHRAALWNAGTVLVPLGVLADARIAVVLGGALLIVALGGSARGLLAARRAGTGDASRRHLAYAALLLLLGASVVVGIALAWDRPWI